MPINMCVRCEIEFGEPQLDCDKSYCGVDIEEIEADS